MQRIIKSLAIGLLALSAQHVSAYTNKTYLADRPKGVDSLLERVTLQNMHSSKAEDSFGATFQATGFYNESLKSDDIGAYFFFKDKPNASLNRDTLRLIIPDHNPGIAVPGQPLSSDSNTTVKLCPTIRTYGIMFSYLQDLEKILPGLYFNVRAPIVEVDTDTGLIVAGGNGETVKKFFGGTLDEIQATAPEARQPLNNAKIIGRQSAIGIADIDLRMGYAFLQREHGTLGLNVGLTIPTGNSPEGKNLLEAIYGNGGHWGFGLGIEGRYELWNNENATLGIHANSDYRQLFTNTERRTFGIKGIDLGQYRITAARVANSLTTQGNPAANVLTLSTDVTPGVQLDNVVGFTYTYGGLTVDLGYNLYFRDTESLKLRDSWDDAQIANVYLTDPTTANPAGGRDVPFGTFPAPAPAAVNLTANLATHKDLTTSAINFDSAVTPAQVTNKVLAGVGYIFKEWEYPIMLGFGGHYEIPTKNSAIQTWGFYFKSGIAF